MLFVPSAPQATVYNYSGSMHAVIPVEDTVTIDVSSDVTQLTYLYPLPNSYSYAVNSQTVTVLPTQSFVPAPNSATLGEDSYGNPFWELVWDVLPAGNISGTVSYTVETTADFDSFVTSDPFPLSASEIPDDIRETYLVAGDEVQSDNLELIAFAESQADGFDQQWQVVDALVGWVMDNITYAHNDSIDALSTYQDRYGVCSNYSLLSCALLRAVGIPARYVSGVALSKVYNMPWPGGGWVTADWGAGNHAWIEVYYPSLGWIPYEPQRDLHHIDTHRITYGVAPQDSGLIAGSMSWYTSSNASVSMERSLNPPLNLNPPADMFWSTGVTEGVVDEINLTYVSEEERHTQSIYDYYYSPVVIFNNPPLASSAFFETDQDVVLAGALSGSDADGDALFYTIVAQGALGVVTIADPALGTFLYVPASGVSGSDTFTFKVSDGYVDSEMVTITVAIMEVILEPDNDGDAIIDSLDPDDDNDGMPDSWEVANTFDPFDPADAAGDMDGDTITNLAEYQGGSNPQLAEIFIRGRITASGAPLSGVWVEAASLATMSWVGGRSDSEGFYALAVPLASDYRVSVWNWADYRDCHYDNVSKWTEAKLVDVASGAVNGIDFALQGGESISGTLVNLAAGEIASVEAWSETTRSWSMTTVVGSGTLSDNFIVQGLVPATDYLVNVQPEQHHGGYLQAGGLLGGWEEALTVNSTTDALVITLSESRTLSGTLAGLADGDSAWLTAWSEDAGAGNSVQVVSVGTDVSFTISALAAADDYRLSVQADGYGGGFYRSVALEPVSWSEATLVDLSLLDQEDVSLLLVAGNILSGTLSGLAEGDRATVSAWSESTGGWAGKSVTGTGTLLTFTLGGLAAADDYRVSIYAEGYLDGYYSGTGMVALEDAFLVDTSSSTPETIDFVLSRGSGIAGIVSGLNLGEIVWVEAWSEDAWSWGGVSVVGSGEPATYQLSGLPVAPDYEVHFYPESHVDMIVGNVDSSVNPTNVNCVLQAGNSITGSISGAGSFAQLTVHAESEQAANHTSVTVFADGEGGGSYEISDLSPAADYVIFVETATQKVFYDGKTSRLGVDLVDISASDSSGVDFVLDDVALATYAISGLIDPLPAAGKVWVDVWDESSGVWAGTAIDASGTFSLNLPGGSYKVAFYGEGLAENYYQSVGIVTIQYQQATAVILAADQALGTFSLAEGYTISGTVYLDANGNGIGDAGEQLAEGTVELVGATVSKSAVSNGQGKYKFTGVAGGNYTFALAGEFGNYTLPTVTVGSDLSDHEIIFGGASYGDLAGTVNVSDAPVVNAVVKIFAGNGVFVNAVQTDAQGNYAYNGLTADATYTVTVDVNGDGETENSSTVVIAAGETSFHDVNL